MRFIYAHPRDWYLTINVEDKRDVIEYPIVEEMESLLKRKKQGMEKELPPAIPALNKPEKPFQFR